MAIRMNLGRLYLEDGQQNRMRTIGHNCTLMKMDIKTGWEQLDIMKLQAYVLYKCELDNHG